MYHNISQLESFREVDSSGMGSRSICHLWQKVGLGHLPLGVLPGLAELLLCI
jgi:hypothetical protein